MSNNKKNGTNIGYILNGRLRLLPSIKLILFQRSVIVSNYPLSLYQLLVDLTTA